MLEKKEKAVMLFLCEVCPTKQTYLISAMQIAEELNKKFLLSIAELDEIMVRLSKENYIELTLTSAKKGYYYCVAMKDKGIMFKKDLKRKRKELFWLISKTFIITALSFIFGLILKLIFN